MKLWLLRPIETNTVNPWKPWYDKAFGFVVRAETESEARRLASEDAGAEEKPFNPWLDAEYSTCIELTSDGLAEVVMKDFDAA